MRTNKKPISRAEIAREFEARGADHMMHRRWGDAQTAFLVAADKWRDLAVDLENAGETMIADTFRDRARRLQFRADTAVCNAVECYASRGAVA